MTASDWDGIMLPRRVCEQLEAVARAMQATIGDPTAAPVRVLLWGQPGVGKTEIMRAFARHLGLHAVFVASADLTGSFIGQTSMAVKKLFARARAQPPGLLLIDAFDDNFPADTREPHHAERLTEFVTELDGVRHVAAVNIVAEAHDPQKVHRMVLARDFQLVEIPLPDEGVREAFLRRELQQCPHPLEPGVDDACAELSRLLEGRTCRDLRILLGRAFRGAAERAMQSDRGVDEMVVTRELFFDDEMVTGARARIGSRASSAGAAASHAVPALDALGLAETALASARQFVNLVRNREKLVDHGIQLPAAILLGGPAARALKVARAIAQESGLAVIEHSGSDLLARETVEPGAFRRELLKATGAAPCAVVVSDIERMLPRRGSPTWSRAHGSSITELWTAVRLQFETTQRSGGPFVPLFVTSDDLETLDQSIAARIPVRIWTDEPVEAPDPLNALGLPTEVCDNIRRHLVTLAAPEALAQQGIEVPKNWLIVGPESSAAAVARLLAYVAKLPLQEWDGDVLLAAERARAGRVGALLARVSSDAPCALLVRNIDRLTGTRSSLDYDQAMHRVVERLITYTQRRSDRLMLLLATTSRPDAVDATVLSHLAMQVVLPVAASVHTIET